LYNNVQDLQLFDWGRRNDNSGCFNDNPTVMFQTIADCGFAIADLNPESAFRNPQWGYKDLLKKSWNLKIFILVLTNRSIKNDF
jgi:hypothetical protein